jgi:tellurite resistance protein
MSFANWLNGRNEIRIPTPAQREFGPDQDVPEQALRPVDENHDGIPDAIAGICILIDYIDASHAASHRRVIVEKIYEQNDIQYVSGFCLLRQERRTFRADRIQTLRLPPNWDQVKDPLEFLASYNAPHEKSKWQREQEDYAKRAERYARLYDARKAANHGLRILAFVARSDGAIANQERDVIRDYIGDVSELVVERLNEEDASEIASDIDKLFPTKRQVANSLNAIRLYQEQSHLFLTSVKRLVRADGELNQKEQMAFELLVEVLRKPVTESARKRAGL